MVANPDSTRLGDRVPVHLIHYHGMCVQYRVLRTDHMLQSTHTRTGGRVLVVEKASKAVRIKTVWPANRRHRHHAHDSLCTACV
jgi:hypothetical protein